MLTTKAAGSPRVDHAQLKTTADSITANARILISVVREKAGPEALSWAEGQSTAAFLAAEQALRSLQGLPLRGSALAAAKEQSRAASEAVAELADAVKNAGIPADAQKVELPFSVNNVKDAIANLHAVANADVQKRPAVADWNGTPLVVRAGDDVKQVFSQWERKAFEADRNPSGTATGAAREATSSLARIVNNAAAEEAYEQLTKSTPRKNEEVVAFVAEKAYLKDPPRGLARAAVNRVEHPGEIKEMAKHLFSIAGELGLQDNTGALVPKGQAFLTLYDYMESWIRADAQPKAQPAWAEAHAAFFDDVQQLAPRSTATVMAELTQYNQNPAYTAPSRLVHGKEIAAVVDNLFANTKDAGALRKELANNVKNNARPGTQQFWADALANHA